MGCSSAIMAFQDVWSFCEDQGEVDVGEEQEEAHLKEGEEKLGGGDSVQQAFTELVLERKLP